MLVFFGGSGRCCTCRGAARPLGAAAELLGAACSRNSLPEEPAHAACGLTEGSPGWKPNTCSASDRCGEALRGAGHEEDEVTGTALTLGGLGLPEGGCGLAASAHVAGAEPRGRRGLPESNLCRAVTPPPLLAPKRAWIWVPALPRILLPPSALLPRWFSPSLPAAPFLDLISFLSPPPQPHAPGSLSHLGASPAPRRVPSSPSLPPS